MKQRWTASQSSLLTTIFLLGGEVRAARKKYTTKSAGVLERGH